MANTGQNNNNDSMSLRNYSQLPNRDSVPSSVTDILRSFSQSTKDLESLLRQWERSGRTVSRVDSGVNVKDSQKFSESLKALTNTLNDAYRNIGRHNAGMVSTLNNLSNDVSRQQNTLLRTLTESEQHLQRAQTARISAENAMTEALRRQADATQRRAEALERAENVKHNLNTARSNNQSEQVIRDLARQCQEAYSQVAEANRALREANNAVNSTTRANNSAQNSYRQTRDQHTSASHSTNMDLQRLINEVNGAVQGIADSNQAISRLPAMFQLDQAYDNLPSLLRAFAPGAQRIAEQREIQLLQQEMALKQQELRNAQEERRKELENINNFRDAINEFNEAIRQAQQNGDAESAARSTEQRETAREAMHNAQARANELEIQETRLNGELQITERQLDNAEFMARTSTKVITSLAQGIKDIAGNTLGRVMDEGIAGFNRMFDAMEQTQIEIAKIMKLDQGGYDAYTKQLHSMLTDAGITAFSEADLLNESQVLAGMGVTDTDFMSSIAMGAAKLKASGTFFQLDEETVKMMQRVYNEELGATGSVDAAKQAAESILTNIMGTQRGLSKQYNSASAVANGGANEIMATIAPILNEQGASSEDINAAYSSIAQILQATEYAGLDSSVLLQDLGKFLNTGELGSMSAEHLALMQQYGWTQESIRKAIGEGNLSQFFKDSLTNKSDLFGGYTAIDTGYRLSAYGSDMTLTQGMGYGNKGGSVLDNFTELTQSELQSLRETEEEALVDGSYNTVNQKLEKAADRANFHLASIAKHIPLGNELFRDGFNILKGTVGSVTNVLISIFGNRMLTQHLGGANNTGNLGGTGGVGGAGSIGNFLTGGLRSGTAAGTAGAIAGSAVGVVGMATTSIGHALEAESIEEWASATYTDPAFYSGLGTTLGSLIAGPVGGAVGAAIGGAASTLGNWIAEEWVLDDEDPAAEQLEKAAESLTKAGELHLQAAKNIESEMSTQEELFKTYTSEDKRNYLLRKGLLEDEQANLMTEEEINNKFDKEIIKYFEDQRKQLELEQALAQQSSMADTFGKVIGVDNEANFTEDEFNKAMKRDAFKNRMEALNISNHKEYNAYMEHEANLRTMTSAEGQAAFDAINKYQNAMGVDRETAYKQYFAKQIEDGTYTAENIAEMMSMQDDLDQRKEDWKSENDKFQERWKTIMDENPGASPETLAHKYNKKYGTGDDFNVRKAIQGAEYDANKLLIGFATDVNGLPMLAYTDNQGYDTYNPILYMNKFATGKGYVPYNNYPALLHEGEMVLNKPVAERFRKESILSTDYMDTALSNMVDNIVNNSSVTYGDITNNSSTGGKSINFNTSPITSAIESQSDRIELLLRRILQVLTSPYSGSKGYGSPVNSLDSNISRMAQ